MRDRRTDQPIPYIVTLASLIVLVREMVLGWPYPSAATFLAMMALLGILYIMLDERRRYRIRLSRRIIAEVEDRAQRLEARIREENRRTGRTISTEEYLRRRKEFEDQAHGLHGGGADHEGPGQRPPLGGGDPGGAS